MYIISMHCSHDRDYKLSFQEVPVDAFFDITKKEHNFRNLRTCKYSY